MPFPAMPSQIRCPKCQTPFVVDVRTIVDVGQEPDLKEQFLKGQVNVAECPQCGGGGLLSTPLVYHDPAKELLIAYVPSELNMAADQQEKLIGGLVNLVMNELPAEGRKGYFLQPKTVLTLDSLFDTILEADGVSKEALERQRSQLRLLNSLLVLVEDDKSLDEQVRQHKEELDYEFFLLLSDLLDAREREDDQEHAGRLRTLREKLLARVTPAMPSPAPRGASYDELIDLMQKALGTPDWRTRVALNRSRLDYGFFQALTARLEAAQAQGHHEEADRLTDLRKRILDELNAQERLVRDAEDKASLLIMRLLESQDLQKALNEHRGEINEVLVGVLARYVDAAKRQKDDERAKKLEVILQAALEILEEKLPPAVRLINKLLRAEYPTGTEAALEAHRGLLNDAFLSTFDKYVSNLEQGRDADLAELLKKVRPQIVAKMTIVRA